MSGNIDLILYSLAAVDILLYITFIEGYLRNKRMFKVPKVSTPEEAFTFFEKSYKKSFPQDQEGFTWGEAVAKANRIAQLRDFEWDKVQKSLKQYEAHRYGGVDAGQIDTYPILKLAVSLRERIYWA